MNHKIRKFESGGRVDADEIIDPDNTYLDGKDPEDDDYSDEQIISLAGQKDPETTDPPASAGGEEEEEEEEASNHAEYVLKSLGYQTDQIDLGNGLVKSVKDLTETEQLDVITGRLEEVHSFYETKLAEIEANGGSFANEVESVLVKALRDNDYNLAELTKIIAENDPVALAKSASNEDLVKSHLKKLYPDFTEEDISDELQGMAGSSRFDRLASSLREDMMKKPLGEGDLAKAIEKFNTTQNQNIVREFETNKTAINAYVNSVNSFGEVPISPEIKNFILQELIPDSADKDSKFIENINTPERAFRLSFLDKFHEQLMKSTADYYFNLGKAEGDKLSKKFKETPDNISTGNNFNKKKSETNSKKVEVEETF